MYVEAMALLWYFDGAAQPWPAHGQSSNSMEILASTNGVILSRKTYHAKN
jgi:hypothetical protein